MFGVLLIRKEKGCTSHDVVNAIRTKFGTRRVGHAGTLDPQATGLLIVAVGPATRFLQYLPLEPKQYLATVRFGVQTETYDSEGQVVTSVEPPADLLERIQEGLENFQGLIQQLPPMYSAVKVDGKPLYAYARQGQELTRDPRTVNIHRFEVVGGESPELQFRVVCSGGTYVRSLAHDLGQVVGCGAYLAALERVSVGRFRIEDAVSLDEVTAANLVPLDEALPPMPVIHTTPAQTQYIREGRPIGLADPPDSNLAALAEPGGGVYAVARVHGNVLQPECVIPAEALHGIS